MVHSKKAHCADEIERASLAMLMTCGNFFVLFNNELGISLTKSIIKAAQRTN